MDKKIVSTNMNRETNTNIKPSRRETNKYNSKTFTRMNVVNNVIQQPPRRVRNNRQCLQNTIPSEVDFIQANSKIWLNESCLNEFSYSNSYYIWDSIVQINFKSHEKVVCPICMEYPVVGRSDKCGHIYCLSCALQYLQYENSMYKKCALCNEFLSVNRMKRACVMEFFKLNVGDTISMFLMKRNRSSNATHIPAVPICKNIPQCIPFINDIDGKFSDTLICPKNELLTMLEIELLLLEEKVIESNVDKDGTEKFVIEAISYVTRELENAIEFPNSLNINNELIDCDVSADFIKEAMQTCYVYYQNESGDYTFLSPLNWNSLKCEYMDKSLPLPERISGKILEIDTLTCDDDVYYRYRYLKCVPLGATINFVYLDINHLLSGETLEKFKVKFENKSSSIFEKEQLDKQLDDLKLKHENSYCSNDSRFQSINKSINNEIFDPSDFQPLTSATPVTTELAAVFNYAKITKSFTGDHSTIKYKPLPNPSTNIDYDAPAELPKLNLSDCIISTKKKTKKNRK